MASGELIVSIFPDFIMMELFKKTGKNKTLLRKHYERISVPMYDLNKVDAMDLEKLICNFIRDLKMSKGKVDIVIFGKDDLMPYHEIDLETTKKKDIKTMLPIEIENLGDNYIIDYNYKYDVLGSQVKLYFLKKNIIEHLSKMEFPDSWELGLLIPGYITYQGIVPDDGVIVEVGKDAYTIYGFRKGFIHDIEEGSIYQEFSIDRPIDPTPNEVFKYIEEDVKQYVSNYNFKESLDIDLVTVLFNDNFREKFTPYDLDEVRFEKLRDLREYILIDESEDIFKDSEGKLNCHVFDYSGVSLGLMYLGNKSFNYDFSTERLGMKYKNLLVLSASFSIMLMTALPSVSMLAEKQVSANNLEMTAYEQNISKYNDTIKSLHNKISENDKIIEDYNSYVSSLESLNNVNRNFISSVLNYLPENTPSSVVVKELVLDKNSKNLVVKGVSQSYKDIGALAIQLEKFGSVKINDISNNELLNDKGYPFEIELRSR